MQHVSGASAKRKLLDKIKGKLNKPSYCNSFHRYSHTPIQPIWKGVRKYTPTLQAQVDKVVCNAIKSQIGLISFRPKPARKEPNLPLPTRVRALLSLCCSFWVAVLLSDFGLLFASHYGEPILSDGMGFSRNRHSFSFIHVRQKLQILGTSTIESNQI